MTGYLRYLVLFSLVVFSSIYFFNMQKTEPEIAERNDTGSNSYDSGKALAAAHDQTGQAESSAIEYSCDITETDQAEQNYEESQETAAAKTEDRASAETGAAAGTDGNIEEEIMEEDKAPPLWDDELVKQLSFLRNPIPGAHVSSRDTQLPGAPRPYRNGTHEGLDYYQGFCGVPVLFGDPVYTAGAGVVIRVDHDYSEPSVPEREKMLQKSAALADTPGHILDKLRGRQVWVVHAFDVVTRYAHLDTVNEELQVGDWIEAGKFIGTVGNSGTSNGARGTEHDAHLHFEIWLGDHYLGKGLPPQEVRALWQRVLE